MVMRHMYKIRYLNSSRALDKIKLSLSKYLHAQILNSRVEGRIDPALVHSATEFVRATPAYSLHLINELRAVNTLPRSDLTVELEPDFSTERYSMTYRKWL